MGVIQSLLSTEAVFTLAVIGGLVLGLGIYSSSTPPANLLPATGVAEGTVPNSKKGKKKKATSSQETKKGTTDAPASQPVVVPFPPVIPGSLDVPAVSATSSVTDDETAASVKKPKKKKAKKATPVAPEASNKARKQLAPVAGPSHQAEDEAWTRVETRRKGASTTSSTSQPLVVERSASDAGVTTSVTGTSSPITAATEDEVDGATTAATSQRPLAERLLPKPRKTKVDDMLETPDHPALSRVMRVTPAEGEKPAAGFSWGDYEDVNGGDDADGEDDGGEWGVVKSKKSNNNAARLTSSAKAPSAPPPSDKKARQNAAKREAQKAVKAEAEADRLARLAQHRRELERAKIQEQYANKGKNTKAVSGGMSATVSDTGKLVWE